MLIHMKPLERSTAAAEPRHHAGVWQQAASVACAYRRGAVLLECMLPKYAGQVGSGKIGVYII